MKSLLRIVLSLFVVTAVAGAVVYGTRAFFSDTEVSKDNTFVAGAIDLTVDSTAHYAGMVCKGGVWVDEDQDPANNAQPELLGKQCTGTWELTDLTKSQVFFNYADIKPGDMGENTISLHVNNNDAWMCATITPTLNDDMSSTEPELEAGDVANTDSIFDGELAQNMKFSIWADMCEGNTQFPNALPGDNIYQAGCDGPYLTQGAGLINPVTWALATPAGSVFGGTAMTGGKTYYIGVDWSLPTTVGNQAQTDKYMADISFYAEQSRNNPNFVCPVAAGQVETGKLTLENETIVNGGPWEVIADDVFVDMTYNSSGPTFNWTLKGKALAADTEYDLIYYADGWPGNKPGAYLGTVKSDPYNMIDTLGSANLGIDLPSSPDGNLAKGAKIWLVLSQDYDNGTKSMTAWNPAEYLFEGNVYIHYDYIAP